MIAILIAILFIKVRNQCIILIDYLIFLDEGFSTFDLADIYGPAEGYVGDFKAKSPAAAKDCQV
jgi:aryl-alcohol dehydrogenase-like predicted oxidoreductase